MLSLRTLPGSGAAALALALASACAPLAEDLAAEAEPSDPSLEATPSIPAVSPVSQAGCVTDLGGHATLHWPETFGDEVMEDQLSEWLLPDVDGDGMPESMLASELHCGASGNCPRLLYLSNHGCPAFGQGLWAGVETETILDTTHHGVSDLEVYLKDGCAGLAGGVDRLEWSGDHYEVVETIECGCPYDEPDAPRDPKCPLAG
ncbi:MAG: hypothetical protein H6712_04075 [Myxococcales bacterium]|nr:hypothetical protein [Myxococcales bacterium]MCB9713005.1 hypothetical protein [Myxococcales bacterium]